MSGSQQIKLQWRGPPVPRAKPVPPEKWEEHKEELHSLYQRMTLDDLMAMMKVRHIFTPSYVPNHAGPSFESYTSQTFYY